nr:immunoglobulin light chain junction region [Macaca mulatta]
CMLALEFPPTF